tara:strand:+ start:219 stop:1094 length:876 start_codon:yes stop_codon:yes gene_type:complete
MVDSTDDNTTSKHGPGLYLVATPIGNLGDIPPRALDLFRHADVVACEDTRTTGRLLQRFGIKRHLVPYHEHNAERARPLLMAALAEGKSVALASDAGTPLISDPGYKLVREATAGGFRVSTVPGPSSVIAALTVSGLPTDRFYFAGFLPSKSGARAQAIASIAAIDATLVMLESAQRLPAMLADFAAVFPSRPAAIARELTKLHEEVRRGSLAELAAHYAEAGPPKGEIVVVVGPPDPTESETATADSIDRDLREALLTMRPSEAAASVAARLGLPRKQVYARAMALKDEA